MKWRAQTFSPIFGVFEIFDRNFAKSVAPPGGRNWNYVVPVRAIPCEKTVNLIEIDP